MLTPEETRKIASKVLSSKEINHSMTLVPHEEGGYHESGLDYRWRSFHVPQCNLFLLTRRVGKDGPLQFANYGDVTSLTRAAALLRQDGPHHIDWRSLA